MTAMPGMKISLDAAMRARDVSQPTAADEAAAASLGVAADGTQPPDRIRTETTSQRTRPGPAVRSPSQKRPRLSRGPAAS